MLVGLILSATGVVVAIGRHAPTERRHATPTVNVGAVPGSSELKPPSASSTKPQAEVLAGHHSIADGASLRLPRFGISAPITPVRVIDEIMQIPLDPHTVGWWTSGAAPGGAHGTTVIVGHINYHGVTGALSVLPQFRPGDVVTVAAHSAQARFTIAAVRTYPKSTGIPQSVFTTAGAPRLALITCGGPFDSATGNYQDNIVAYAVPAGA